MVLLLLELVHQVVRNSLVHSHVHISAYWVAKCTVPGNHPIHMCWTSTDFLVRALQVLMICRGLILHLEWISLLNLLHMRWASIPIDGAIMPTFLIKMWRIARLSNVLLWSLTLLLQQLLLLSISKVYLVNLNNWLFLFHHLSSHRWLSTCSHLLLHYICQPDHCSPVILWVVQIIIHF